MFAFLLVVHAIVAAALVTVILMQRSEGGGLGMGGSPSGLMSARGAADFLTRSTAVLAAAFVSFSIVLAFVAAHRTGTATIDTSLARPGGAVPKAQIAPPPAADGAPFTSAAQKASTVDNEVAPVGNDSVPLAR